MTSEHLLDAMGLLDDDLLQDAEVLPAPKNVVPLWTKLKPYASLAACLVLVTAMGYALTHTGTDNKSCSAPSAPSGSIAYGGENAQAPDGMGSGSDALEDMASPDASAEPTESAPPAEPESSSPAPSVAESGTLYLDGNPYRLLDETVGELPPDRRELGTLSALDPDAPSLCTDVEDYVGCPVFQTPDGLLYVQLPQGGWAVAEPVQP